MANKERAGMGYVVYEQVVAVEMTIAVTSVSWWKIGELVLSPKAGGCISPWNRSVIIWDDHGAFFGPRLVQFNCQVLM
jgi:hypothetical protein